MVRGEGRRLDPRPRTGDRLARHAPLGGDEPRQRRAPRHEAKTVSGHATDEVFDRYSIGTAQQQRAALGAVTPDAAQFEAERALVPLDERRRTATKV